MLPSGGHMTVAGLGARSELSLDSGGLSHMSFHGSNRGMRTARVLGVAITVCAVMLGMAASAYAAGAAQFSAPVPLSAAQFKVKPAWISVTADDSAPITSATIRINGTTVPVSIDYPIGALCALIRAAEERPDEGPRGILCDIPRV